jgi:AsmA protein
MKKLLIVIAGVVVLLLIIALVLPSLIDVNKYRPMLETDLTAAMGRKVQIGNIRLSILSGGASVDDLSIADDPAFSHGSFLTAKELTVGVNLLPLIFSKKLEVRSFKVTDPQVTLLRTPSGTWNYSSLGGAAAKKSSSKGASSTAATDLSVETLAISNGTIVVGVAGGKGKPKIYNNVNLEASDLSMTTQFPFKLSAKTPGGGTVKVEGKAGPVNQNDASLTPLDAKIDVSNFDLASTGFVDPSSGIAGTLEFKGSVASNGEKLNAKGTVKIDKLKAAPAGAPASVPVTVDYTTEYELKAQKGVLSQGDVHIGKALARLNGSYSVAGESATLQMKLNGQAMPVPDLEGVLPAVGVMLPSGASLKTGTIEINLAVSGPVDHLTITGPVNLSDAKLAGFNAGSKLGALGSFAGLGGKGGSDTEIKTLSTNVRVDPSGTHAENLNVVVPSIGTITGNANISPDGKLDCKMVAKLSVGGDLLGGVASRVSPFGGGSQGGIPFKVEGTTANPIFLPDIGGMVGNAAKNPVGVAGAPAAAATGAVKGLFGKKKTTP